MFELPRGEPVDGEMDLSLGRATFPFEFGAISYFKPRAKKPVGHRLVCAGEGAGWLCESGKSNRFVAGSDAEVELRKLDASVDLRVRGVVWTQSQFERVAMANLEAFTDPASLGTLLPMPRIEGNVPTKDLALLVESMCRSEEVRGACALEDGMLVNVEGELPADAETFATMIQSHLDATQALGKSVGDENPLSVSIAMGDGGLLVAPAGDAAIAAWTSAEADHTALLANAAAMVRSSSDPLSDESSADELPEGVVVKDSKGGIDRLLSALKTAKDESTTGYLASIPTDGSIVAITLIDGIPVGLRSAGHEDLDKAVTSGTSSSNRLELVRLERSMRLVLGSSSVSGWSLQALCEAISTCRTRSDDRRSLLLGRLETLYGFELGLEEMENGRSTWKMVDDGKESAGLPGVTRKSMIGPVVAELQVRVQRQQDEISRLHRDKEKAIDTTDKVRAQRDELTTETAALQSLIDEARDDRMALSRQLDESTLRIREEQASAEEQSARAERLARRVSELEVQVRERAEELSSALGEMNSRQELLDALDGILKEEARAKSELAAAEARMTEVRQSIDSDEQSQRVLHEQVNAQRESQRRVQAELSEVERNIESRRDELSALESDAHSTRGVIEEERLRAAEMDRKHTLLQSELRELMEERRQLMRELGDLDTRRGSAEADLRMLIEQAEDLQEAHELALADIAEADRIRARLSEEPLAQALMGDSGGLAMLEPVLSRMSSARSRGFSVILLDRAVERGLQIIQHTVDEVAKTPRYLLSTEVMDLLSQQAPETADTVKSLTKWSVQNRLEHKLSETVSNVVLDLENLLNEYEEAVTMLMHLREVLRQMQELGLPADQITPLEKVSHMPEALPAVSAQVRRLLQQALDEIYAESDLRTTGESVGLEATVEVLEKLKHRLDVSGLTGETPSGEIWEFQNSGMLPFESHGLSAVERPVISEDAIAHMNPSEKVAAEEEIVSDLEVSTPEVAGTDSSQTWQPIDAPSDRDGVDLTSRVTMGLPDPEILGSSDELDELSEMDRDLADMDAASSVREATVNGVEPPADPEQRSALESLEDELADLDL